MRFLSAVALALVMLWVPVDGVAQEQEVTITAVEIRFDEFYGTPYMTFETSRSL